ncbi:MAG: GDP-L-fucose synthase [Cyclobacteriaceae bacterium]|nr:GDP-L-fucose synthase [Cyclobacteriaceae bacterium]
MDSTSRIFVAGAAGMVGSAIVRGLRARGWQQIITTSSREVDLRQQAAVSAFFETHRPTHVFMAAAKVGGIVANNSYRAEFLYDNLMMEGNVIHSSHVHGVKKLLFLGSSCIYPKLAPQPLKESYLLSGYLEPTNEPYAVAKIAGLKLCETYRSQYGSDFISAMPTNLYGPNDNYDLVKSHVIPALIQKFLMGVRNQSPTVEVWGTGTPLREFMHVDDLADACIFLMENYSGEEFVNVGTGAELTIRQLAELIAELTGYRGRIVFDSTKPDGTPRKLLDTSKLEAMGWKPRITLREGLKGVIEDVAKRLS